MHQGSGEVQRGVSRKDSFIFSRPLTSRWTPFAERLKHANSRVSIRLSTTQQYNGVFYFSHHDQLLPLDTKVYVTWLKVSLSRPAWWWGKAVWLTFKNFNNIFKCAWVSVLHLILAKLASQGSAIHVFLVSVDGMVSWLEKIPSDIVNSFRFLVFNPAPPRWKWDVNFPRPQFPSTVLNKAQWWVVPLASMHVNL